MAIKNTSEQKQAVLISFKKARTLIDTIVAMVERDEYCVDIMQQNLSAIGLLKSAHERVMKDHLETCFVEGVQKGGVKRQKELIEELQLLMRLYNK